MYLIYKGKNKLTTIKNRTEIRKKIDIFRKNIKKSNLNMK